MEQKKQQLKPFTQVATVMASSLPQTADTLRYVGAI